MSTDPLFPGRMIAPLLALGGIAIWMNFFYAERRRSKGPILARAGRLIKKLVYLSEVDDGKEDYISQLPDDILSSIISRLPLEEAARTSFLCRRWKHLFASMDRPTLQFNCLDMFKVDPCNHNYCPYYKKKFLKGVTQVLQLHSGRKVDHVRIQFCFETGFFSEFDQWMHSISRSVVERLTLIFDCGYVSPPPYSSSINPDPNKLFKFYLDLLSRSSSLKHLSLHHCFFIPNTRVSLNSLRTLYLDSVVLESGHLEGILSSCLNLDVLWLVFCKLPRKIHISSTTVTSVNLKYCGGLEEIDLQAAHLFSFECIFYRKARVYFSFVPMLERVMIQLSEDASIGYIFGDFARDLPAQVIYLSVKASDDQIRYFPTQMHMFRNLRGLALVLLNTCDFDLVNIARLLDACPLLQCLDVLQLRTKRTGGTMWSLSPTSHAELKQVTFVGFHGSRAEIEFAVYILRSAVVLEQMILGPRFTSHSACGVREEVLYGSIGEIKRYAIRGQLQVKAISRDAVVIISH